MSQSEIILHSDGAISFLGGDAIELFRALTLRNHIQLYAKTKLIPTRGMGIRKMLALATQFTGNSYTTKQLQNACNDLTIWIETMRSALPASNTDGQTLTTALPQD